MAKDSFSDEEKLRLHVFFCFQQTCGKCLACFTKFIGFYRCVKDRLYRVTVAVFNTATFCTQLPRKDIRTNMGNMHVKHINGRPYYADKVILFLLHSLRFAAFAQLSFLLFSFPNDTTRTLHLPKVKSARLDDSTQRVVTDAALLSEWLFCKLNFFVTQMNRYQRAANGSRSKFATG
jgi:hypothetical protein